MPGNLSGGDEGVGGGDGKKTKMTNKFVATIRNEWSLRFVTSRNI